jgi:hypothetical protein
MAENTLPRSDHSHGGRGVAMRLLVFFSILTVFAAAWAAYGTSELVAFGSGVIATVMAALIVASPREE